MTQSAPNVNDPAHPMEIALSEAAGTANIPALLGGGRYRMDHRHVCRLRPRPVWIIECFLPGDLEVEVEGAGWQRFSPGQGVLYRAGARYRERCPNRNPCRSTAVFMNPGRSPLFDAWRAGPSAFRAMDDPVGAVCMHISESVAGLEQGGAGELRAQASLANRGHPQHWGLPESLPRNEENTPL